MQKYIDFIKDMVTKGGPELSEYAYLSSLFSEIANGVREERITPSDVEALRDSFGVALSLSTIQGFGFLKPHGYAGDYEFIKKLYEMHMSDNPHLIRWDKYSHAQSAPTAVRNRKQYFQQILSHLESHNNNTISVLNVASGPSRDLFEFFNTNNGTIKFDCIEWDKDAINYSKILCADFLDNIEFIQANALKYQTSKRYHLIWSAGLFDYLDDKGFISLLKRLYSFLNNQGELVVGNFSENNPSRDYMEIVGDWYLHHRSAEKLQFLALESGIPPSDIRIGQEAEGVNLFLHIKRGNEFVNYSAA